MSEDISQHTSTLLTLVRATARYVYKRIVSEENRLAYKRAMDACILHIEEGWQSMSILRSKINSVREDVDFLYKVGLFSKNKENRAYYLMACDHVEDALRSIELRFISGGSSVYLLSNKCKHIESLTESDAF